MFAIVGATGKVTSLALRDARVPIKAILRDASKEARLRQIGCEIALADLLDSKALAKAISDADAVQIILPPSPQAKDTAEEMRRGIESLASALEEALSKSLLAISDHGAHITHDIRLPTFCRTSEERLRKLDCHRVFLRSAEHMQGWGRAIPIAIESGTLPRCHDPLDMRFPTFWAPDLGAIAVDVLLRPTNEKVVEIVHAEGPRRYSANDVATVLSQLLGRTFNAELVLRSQWKEAFQSEITVCYRHMVFRIYILEQRENTQSIYDLPG